MKSTLEKLARGEIRERWFDRLMVLGLQRFGEQGYNEMAGLVDQTIDGIPLRNLWDEFNRTLRVWNREKDELVSILSYGVTNNVEKVFVPSEADFEEASEFGVPKSIRMGAPFIMGYGFKWYDLAIRFTWQFLAESDAAQVRALNNMAMEADGRLVFNRVMRRLFNSTNDTATINDQAVNVYPIYNGDGTVPPRYKGNTFLSTHTHFLTSGAATVVSGDLDDMATHLKHHGYDSDRGYRLVLLVNEQEGNVIRTFKTASADKYDFIPGPNYGGGVYIPSDQRIVGQPAQNVGLLEERIGTYGPFQIVEDYNIPAGYMVAFATGGVDNLGNLIGIREHDNTSLRGLRLVKGPDADYPLIDSYYLHGLGTGVRHRGAGVVMQVTASGTYTIPTAYA